MPSIENQKSPATGSHEQASSRSKSEQTAPEIEPLSRSERRRQQFEQKRVERKQAPAKQQREQKLFRIGGTLLMVLVLVGVGYVVFDWITTRDDNRKPDGVTTFDYAGGDHSNDTVAYTESPPVGGTHNPVWQTCDFYDGEIPNENAVHSLEHGAVWITYRPDTSDSDKETLKSWANDRPYLLVSEYDDQESPFVFTAWNNELPLDSLGDKKATQFMNYFIQGPQTPERGASCSGGNTSTLG